MLSKEKQEIVDHAEYQLSLLRDRDGLYQTFRQLVKDIPNDQELGEAVRLLFTSNVN